MKIDEIPSDIQRIQEKRHKKGPPQEHNRCRRLAISTKKKQIPSDIQRILKTNPKEQEERHARPQKEKSRADGTATRGTPTPQPIFSHFDEATRHARRQNHLIY